MDTQKYGNIEKLFIKKASLTSKFIIRKKLVNNKNLNKKVGLPISNKTIIEENSEYEIPSGFYSQI